MSTHAGDIFINAQLNDKPYHRGLSKLDRSSSKIAGAIGKKFAAVLSVAAFGKFIKDTTAAGASLNAMNAIVDAALPNMTKQVDAFAKHAGAAFGLSETQAKGMIGKYASMASAMGYTEKQAYQMSTALTGLAGDVASYYHISQDDAALKLNAVFSGETEALKQLGVVMTQNALDQFALQQGFGKTTRQMTELEKTTLRYQFVMDRLKLASGDFAKYANTWSGSIATIKLNWSNFMATVGQGIINILLPLLQLIARVSNALTALGSRFLAWTQKITGKAKGAGSAIQGAFGKQTQKDLTQSAGGVGNLGSGLGKAGKAAKGTHKAIKALKRELLGFDQITKLTKQDTSTGTTGSSGVGGGVGGGGGIDVGEIDFGATEEDIKSFSERAKDYLSGIKLPAPLREALDHLRTAFHDLFDTLGTAGKWAMDNILEPLGKWTMNELAPVAVEALADAIDFLKAALELLGKIFKPIWENILKPFFEALGKQTIENIENVSKAFETATKGIEWFSKKWDEANERLQSDPKYQMAVVDETESQKQFDSLIDKLKQKWDEAGDLLQSDPKYVKVTADHESFSDTLNEIKKKWNDFKAWWDGLKVKALEFKAEFLNNVKDKWDEFQDWWDGLKGAAKKFGVNWFNNVETKWDDFQDWWEKTKGGARKFGVKWFNGVYEKWKKFKAWWKGLKGGTKKFGVKFTFTDKLKDGWNTLADKVNNARAKSIIVRSLIPYIPRLAQGGYVKANTPQLAMIGDNKRQGEIVAPESKLQAMANQAASSGNAEIIAALRAILQAVNALDLNVNLDGEKVKNNVVKRINNHTRQTGQLEIIM